MKTFRAVQAIGGKRIVPGIKEPIYFRSRWEFNIACYLQWLKGQEYGGVFNWVYEPKGYEWEFPVKRGTRFYKPDFLVTTRKGVPFEVWEVKGWMDRPSRTALCRMKQYFPAIKIHIIAKEEYQAIKKCSKLIPGWES